MNKSPKGPTERIRMYGFGQKTRIRMTASRKDWKDRGLGTSKLGIEETVKFVFKPGDCSLISTSSDSVRQLRLQRVAVWSRASKRSDE